MAHTEGPWALHIGDGTIRARSGFVIAQMRATCVTDMWEADASLIAAAPEMLDAIRELIWDHDATCPANTAADCPHGIPNRARALLAKIDGGAA